MTSTPLISVTIVSWNCREDLHRCLRSLEGQIDAPSYEVIVIDNASTDGSAELVEALHPTVRLVKNERNDGFGRAQNMAANLARGDALLLLNPDTELDPRTIRELHSYYDPDLVIAPSLTFRDGTLQRTAHRRWPSAWSHAYQYSPLTMFLASTLRPTYNPTLYSHAEHATPLAPLHVMGAVVLLARSRFLESGGFDERFFLYLEETELFRRLRLRGVSIRYFPEIRVRHRMGGSSGEQQFGQANPHYLRSAYQFLEIRYGRFGAHMIRVVTTLVLLMNYPFVRMAALLMPGNSRVAGAWKLERRALAWHLKGPPCTS